MNWFKFYAQDFLTDPKMMRLNTVHRLAWIYILSIGSQSNGCIDFLDENTLAGMMGIQPTDEDWESLKGVFQQFVDFRMITNDNGHLVIINWQKRQQSNLTGYERVKRFRDKNKDKLQNNKAKLNVNVINDNVSDNKVDNMRRDKIRIDIDKNTHTYSDVGVNYLENLPESDIEAFTKTYKVEKNQLLEKAEALFLWAKSKHHVKRDFRATLQGALLRDFGKRPAEKRGVWE